MKKIRLITSLIILLAVNTLVAQITFEKFYTGVGEATKVAEHEDGGFTFLRQHPVPWPGIGYKNYLTRTDAFGEEIWTVWTGEVRNIADFCLTTNDEYLLPGHRYIGYYNTTPVLLKLDQYGNLVDTIDVPIYHRCITGTHDNHYMLAGEKSGVSYPMLAKITGEGDTVWTKSYDLFEGQVSGLVKNANNGFTITGFNANDTSFILSTDMYGNMVWFETYENFKSRDVIQTWNYGFMAIGGNNSDVVLIRTDTDGDLVWNKIYSFGGNDWGTAVCKSRDFGYTFSVSKSALQYPGGLCQIDINGDMIWYQSAPGSLFDVKVTDDGGLITSGYYLRIYSSKSPYLLKTTQSGYITSLETLWDPDGTIKFFPNPFSNSANILYEVISRGRTRISIFDIHGRMISLIVDEIQEPGQYEISFDATEFPDGIYLCKIETGNKKQTLKIVKQ